MARNIINGRILIPVVIALAGCTTETDEPEVADCTEGWARFDLEPWTGPVQSASARRAQVKLTRDEIANALRPVLITPDGLFVTRAPNWAAADAVLRERVAMEANIDEAQETIARVIGSDGRLPIDDTSRAPFWSIALMTGLDGRGIADTCTGTYIGPWTYVTAAHCFRMPDGTIGRFMSLGTEVLASTSHHFECNNADANPNNNFLAAIPAAFAISADPAFDFAIVDTFPCHHAPHWFGEPFSNRGIIVNPGTATYSMSGYPITIPPPAPTRPLGALWGMSGSGYANGVWLESQFIDSQPEGTSGGTMIFEQGDRGAPWHVGGLLAGVNVGYREYFDLFRCGFDVCRRNFARRTDAGFISFLNDIAFDYP